jgi:CheY-like chemotaxis protein
MPGGGTERILVVDDDGDVRDLVVQVLGGLGYDMTEAADGFEAIEKLQLRPAPHLMLTDVVMPGELHGAELVRRARLLVPGIKVLFTSGYPERTVHQYDEMLEGAEMITKPYQSGDLARKVREVLDKPAS